MDGFGELFRGIAEIFGERAGEAAVDSGEGSGGEQTREAYVRVLVGGGRQLNINDV